MPTQRPGRRVIKEVMVNDKTKKRLMTLVNGLGKDALEATILPQGDDLWLVRIRRKNGASIDDVVAFRTTIDRILSEEGY